MARICKRAITPEVRKARRSLSEKGYTYVLACEALKVSYTHLAYVLTCRRTSGDLLRRIHELPERDAAAA